ncbi:MAG: hypothetical protein HC929_02350 [Leptolyngbyaceae cyanobacterium SM2_5_2]|nr:hypothetical protein [Leptolyngbyaceae cyanobacterium SM2_5_2]
MTKTLREGYTKSSELSDQEAQYSDNYEVVQRYVGNAGMVALLLLPKDRDKHKNAIVIFRGTAASIDALSKLHNEPTGVRTDTDLKGVAFNAYSQGKEEMEVFYTLASPYKQIIVIGHSLGGALAQRFYHHISKEFPVSELRLVTYQSAPIDKETASNIDKNKSDNILHVRGRGDIVPKAGSAHIAGKTLKYDAIGDVSKHLAIPLANDQIDRAKSEDDLLEIMDYTLDKVVKNVVVGGIKDGDTSAFYSTGRRLGGFFVTPFNVGRDLAKGEFTQTHFKGGKKSVQSIPGIDKLFLDASPEQQQQDYEDEIDFLMEQWKDVDEKGYDADTENEEEYDENA